MARSAGPSRTRSSATKSFEEALGEPLATTVSLTTSTSLATTAASDQRAEDEHDRGGDMLREVAWSHSVWLLHLASCLTMPLYNTTVCQALRRPLRSPAVSEFLGTP